MNIVIVGAGDIGAHLATELSVRGHDIRVVDRDESRVAELNEKLDAKVIAGDGSTVKVLLQADIDECDLFIGLTTNDTVNLVAASVAKSLGAAKTIARVHPDRHAEQWLFSYRDSFQVDHLFCPERLTAVELAKHVRNPNRVAVEELCHGRIELQQIVISPFSQVADQPLRSLKLPERVRIAFIQRHGENIVPEADESFQVGDIVTLFGEPARLAEALQGLQAEPDSVAEHNVVILGGGEYGLALAQLLEGSKCRIRILERSKARCEFLLHELPRTVALNVDATSLNELTEEQVGAADFFIAVTGHDEDNVMMCLQAATLGTQRTIALVQRADYADVITDRKEQLGIAAAVSPRSVTTRDLLRFVTSEKFHTVMTLPGDTEVIGFPISEKCPLNERPVAELGLPSGATLVAAIRGSEAFVPSANDVIRTGDTIYTIVTAAAKKAVIKLFR